MDVNTVAIRLESPAAKPEGLKGNPIFIFAEQNQQGAGRREAGASGDPIELSIGGALEAADLPPWTSRSGRSNSPTPDHQIREIVFVIDRSSSMEERIETGSISSKFRYLQERIESFRTDHMQDVPISVVAFNHKAKLTRFDTGGSFDQMCVEIAETMPEGGTNFENALLLSDISLGVSHAKQEDGRTLLVFITDGEDSFDSREAASKLAAQIRGHNVTTVMIGVGSNWDYKNVIDLSGKFGPGGWAHIPMAPGQDVIALLLNEVLVDLRSADRYLSVFSEQPNNKLYGLSPSIREGDEGRFFAGYQRSLEAVCFSPHLDPMLKLSCGLHVGDLRPEILEIPVIDVHDPKAGIYFEQTERARQLLGPILVQIAMLEGNYELLGSLKDQHPELAEKIQVLIENMRDFANADASMATRASVSSVGNTVIMTRRNVNALSRVDIPKRRGDPSELPPQAGFGQVEGEGESAQAPNLYSGMVGPLDVAPGTDLPPLDPQDLDPRAYDHVVPVGAAKLSYVTADGYQELDLGALFSTRSSILIGRGRSADIVFGEPSVSTIHAEIGRDEHGFYLLDRNSTNGTFVNNTRISGPCYLKNGDEIRIGSTSIEFHA